ncbi:MAG: ABC transporter permease [Truepera sp.]|nr:ABC transporter permease [Truepera sp.]
MFGFLLRRTFFALVVVAITVTIVFVVIRIVPGDPAALMLGIGASEEEIAALRAKWGLDRPLFIQYATYLWQIVRGDFGTSILSNLPVLDIILQRLPNTLALAALGLISAVAFAIPLGVVAALNVNTILDRLIVALALIGRGIPAFWTGIMAILLFSRTWELLPSFGMGGIDNFILPSLVLGSVLTGLLTRLTRSEVLEEMSADYVRTARAKGLPERLVLWKHILRNALNPVVTVIGLQLGRLLGGTIIVEVVFAWPGIGRLLVLALQQNDYAIVQALIILFAFFFVLINIAVDILYTVLNPRVRLA